MNQKIFVIITKIMYIAVIEINILITVQIGKKC